MPVLTEELTRLAGHRWQVSCLGFSPDGTRLASGGWDKEVNVWDLSNLEVVHNLKGAHDVPVTTLSWHRPAGLILCAGSADHTASLWNAASGRHMTTLREHGGWVLGSCFSATGSYLATSSWDKNVRVWDPNTSTVINTLSGHTAGVWSVDFHPRSSQLCSASEDGTIKIWDARSSRVIRTLSGGHSDAIYCAKWSPDGAMIASGSADTKICVWEPSKGAVINTIYGHLDTVKSVAFNPQTLNVALPVLASAGDFTLRLSDPRPDQRADILSLMPHSQGKEVETVAISPDGSLLVSGGRDGLLVLMTLFVPSIMPRSESTFSTSSVLRRSRVVRDRSYIFDATQEEEIPELEEEGELEAEMEAEMEAEALDEILAARKKPERQTSFNRMKRRSRYEHKQTELPDHATVRRKGVSAKQQRGKRIKEKMVDIPTMVAHLSAAIHAYGPEEPSSSESEEDTATAEEEKVKVDVVSRVAEFSNPEALVTAVAPPRKLSLDNVGLLSDRRELFEKKIREEQEGLKDADDTEQEYLASDGLTYSMPGELDATLPMDAAYSINTSGSRFRDFSSPERSPVHDPGAYEHRTQPFSPTLSPAPEYDEDLVFEEELGSGDEYGDDIPLSTI